MKTSFYESVHINPNADFKVLKYDRPIDQIRRALRVNIQRTKFSKGGGKEKIEIRNTVISN